MIRFRLGSINQSTTGPPSPKTTKSCACPWKAKCTQRQHVYSLAGRVRSGGAQYCIVTVTVNQLTTKMNAKKTLLLIGAGPTSSLISYIIAKNPILRDAIDIHVFEKSKGIGGRFATSRSPNNGECYADLGAQYLTHTLTNKSSNKYFEDLKSHNLIRQLETDGMPGFRSDPDKIHYACVQGAASVVKHFFKEAGVNRNNVGFNSHVTQLDVMPNGKVQVTTANQNRTHFDLVISTIPVPQILQLQNTTELIEDSTRRKLEAVNYSTRFALGLFFDKEVHLKTSNLPLNFVDNDPILRFWSIENVKRTGSFKGPTSVVIHTNVDFGARNDHEDKDAMKPILLQAATKIVPEAAALESEAVKSHKWRYSQVLDAYIGLPGCVALKEHIYAAGDGLSGSGFEGCIASAEQTVLMIQNALRL